MKSTEFIQTDEDIAPAFVNQTISATNQWQRKGKGETASVWQHINDPHTVVKVIGGGSSPLRQLDRDAAIAFYHFCVDHGHESPHFPRVVEINIDDPEVVQIRIEALRPLPSEQVGESLEWLCETMIDVRHVDNCEDDIDDLQIELKKSKMSAKNSAINIALAMQILLQHAPSYERAHNVKELYMDLHSHNWMMRPDGTIVAADPWYAQER